jgi:hypothetical protein
MMMCALKDRVSNKIGIKILHTFVGSEADGACVYNKSKIRTKNECRHVAYSFLYVFGCHFKFQS